MRFIAILLFVLFSACSANIDAGFAFDPVHQDDYGKIMGVVRVSQDVSPSGEFYYEHISHIETSDDQHGINLFGFNYRLK